MLSAARRSLGDRCAACGGGLFVRGYHVRRRPRSSEGEAQAQLVGPADGFRRARTPLEILDYLGGLFGQKGADRQIEPVLASALYAVARRCGSDPNTLAQVHGRAEYVQLEQRLDEALPRLRGRELAQMCWAYGVLRRGDTQRFLRLAASITPHLDQLPLTSVSTMLTGFARGGMARAPFFDDLTPLLLEHIPEMDPRLLSTIAWACSKLEIPAEGGFWDSVAGRGIELMGEMDPGSLASLAGALGDVGVGRSEFYAAMEDHVLGTFMMYGGWHVASITWSCARTNHQCDALMGQLLRSNMLEAQQTSALLGPGGAANLLWAFGALDYSGGEAGPRLAALVAPAIDRLTLHGLGQVAWGLACLGQLQPTLMAQVFRRVHEARDVGRPTMTMLYQADLALRQSGVMKTVGLRPHQREAFRLALSQQAPSPLVDEVQAALAKMHATVVRDHVTHEGYRLALAQPDRGVGIVPLGPQTYSMDPHTRGNFRLMGEARLQMDLLKAAGWHIVQIPHHEWAACAADQRAKYLRRRVAAVMSPHWLAS